MTVPGGTDTGHAREKGQCTVEEVGRSIFDNERYADVDHGNHANRRVRASSSIDESSATGRARLLQGNEATRSGTETSAAMAGGAVRHREFA